MVKYCPSCGSELQDDARFCRKCGASITGEAGKMSDTLSTVLIVIGYVMSFLMPLVSIIIAIYLIVKNSRKHGVLILLLTFIVMLFRLRI